MTRYAQIDRKTGVVVSDSQLREVGMEKEHPNLIPIEDDFDLSMKRYDCKNEEWVEYVEEEPEQSDPEPTEDPIMEKLETIESKIQTNEELQTFYDDIVKEVGLV